MTPKRGGEQADRGADLGRQIGKQEVMETARERLIFRQKMSDNALMEGRKRGEVLREVVDSRVQRTLLS